MSPAEETELPESSRASWPWITKPPLPAATAARSISAAKAAGLAEHHIAVARLGAGVAGAVGTVCSDDEVVEAVAVDVAGRGHRPAGEIVRILAMDDEAAVAGRDRSKVDLRRKAAGLAEHHVAVARLDACVAGAIAELAPR